MTDNISPLDGLCTKEPAYTPVNLTQGDSGNSHLLEENYYYDLSQKRIAHIFNHYEYDNNKYGIEIMKREGTHDDCNRLKACLQDLNFDVSVHNDFKRIQILKMFSKMQDEDSTSCLIVVIMTHGDSEKDGTLLANDAVYTINEMLEFFTAKNAEKLKSKPKLFFIQACRGSDLDEGLTITTDGANFSASTGQKISNHADIMVMYSSYSGHVSLRGWLITSLCKNLRRHFRNFDMMSILTFVIGDVSLEYESGQFKITDTSGQEKIVEKLKQTPQITSTLRKLLKFDV